MPETTSGIFFDLLFKFKLIRSNLCLPANTSVMFSGKYFRHDKAYGLYWKYLMEKISL